ncbi:MAG: cytochrome c biogenesis protein CcdA [Elusimicrobiota bacterium]
MSFLIAFLAGLASFLSPCVLPLIPVYLAYLTGTTYDQLVETAPRARTLAHSAFFILGFSLVFILLGASASVAGDALQRHGIWIERAGGAFLILLGLWMSGLFRAGVFDRLGLTAVLYKDARWHFQDKPAGFLGSVLVGAAFAAGWTPCVGPVLAGILLLASRSGSVGQGVLLLCAYSAGFALPLLLCALAVDRFAKVLSRIKPWLPVLEKATGAALALVGLALAMGSFSRASTWALSFFSGWSKLFSKLGV